MAGRSGSQHAAARVRVRACVLTLARRAQVRKLRPRRDGDGNGGEALEVQRPARPRAGAARPSEAPARAGVRAQGTGSYAAACRGAGTCSNSCVPGSGATRSVNLWGQRRRKVSRQGGAGQAKLWRPSDWRDACRASGVACSDKCGSPATAVSSRGARTSETYLCARRASTGQGGSRGRARSTCAGRPTACCVARAACEGVARARTGQRSSP